MPGGGVGLAADGAGCFGAAFVLQVGIHPFQPEAVALPLPNRVGGVVRRHGPGNELGRHAIVLQGMVELVGLRDGHPGVAGVGQNQGGRADAARRADGGLLAVGPSIVFAQPGRGAQRGRPLHVGIA